MGSFADIQKVIKALAKVPSQIASSASGKIADLIEAEYASGSDPYGRGWADLADSTKARGRSAPPLTDTGAMRGSVEVKPMPWAGIQVTINDPAVHHQYGTVNMPQRAIYPNQAMPDTWKQAIQEAADEAFNDAAGGLRE